MFNAAQWAARWADSAVGTRYRLGLMCSICVMLAVLQMQGCYLLFRYGALLREFPQSYLTAFFAVLCASTIVGSVLIPVLSLVVLRIVTRGGGEKG